MCLQYRFSQSTDSSIYPQSVCVSVYELIELLSFFFRSGVWLFVACFVLGFSFNSLWKMDRWTDRQTDVSLWMMMSLSMAVELVNALVTPKNGWSSFRGHYLVFISTYCCPMWHWYISSYSRLSPAKARMRSCCWLFFQN